MDKLENMDRRDFLKSSTALAVTGSLGVKEAAAQSGSSRKPAFPNILIFTFDDCDAGAFGAFGSKLTGVTPNFDQLATQSLRFTHAFANSPTCQPSRTSLLTGNDQSTNRTWGHSDPLPSGIPTLPSVLRDNGYYCAIIGKQPHYKPPEAFNWTRSADENGNFLTADTWDETNDGYQSFGRSPQGFYQGVRELVAESSGSPFFIHINTTDPHRPWPGSIDEAKWFKVWRENTEIFTNYDLKKILRPLRPFAKQYSPLEVPVPDYLPDLSGVRVDLAQYNSALHNGDKALGRVIAALSDAGVVDETVIIVLSDQGASFPMSKQSLYPHGLNLGLLIKWPGETVAGSVNARLISNVDLMPTILAKLGLDVSSNMDGQPIRSLVDQNASSSERDYLFAQYTYARPGLQVFPMRSILTKDYLYVYNGWSGKKHPESNRPIIYDGAIDPLSGLAWRSIARQAARSDQIRTRWQFIRSRSTSEFYDLRADPFCLRNLAGEAAQRARMKSFEDLLVFEMNKRSDPLLPTFLKNAPLPETWF